MLIRRRRQSWSSSHSSLFRSLVSSQQSFFISILLIRIFQTFFSSFMKDSISEHIIDACFQLRDFLRTDHKFFDLVAIDIKFLITDIISQNSSSATSRSTRTRREKFTEIDEDRWSQFWAVNRLEFRKAVIFLEKVLNLSSNFVSRHSRESSKNSSSSQQFVSLRLTLSERFSFLMTSTDLIDQILSARQQSRIDQEHFTVSFLIFASFISRSSEISTRNSKTITSTDSSNMSRFSEFSNQTRSNIASFSDFTFESMFSAAQRTKIADIVAIAMRSLQNQQQNQQSSSSLVSTRARFSEEIFTKEWNFDEIDFFDLELEEDELVVNVDRHVFYRDVYAFVDRLKNMIKSRDDDKLRTILSQCLRDSVLI